jgi:phage shock protein PspC (stress-responsive transcriptional regulator)
MKKNININISGIIFYIEEDGYDLLKDYLLSIHKYFSAFEDSTEIIADIENRIAEIFLAKLGENRQVITLENIEELIATMGSVADFQAVEEESLFKGTKKATSSQSTEKQNNYYTNNKAEQTYTQENEQQNGQKNGQQGEKQTYSTQKSKKLFRDNKRKLLGGVAAGIAHYLSVDPLWIRLLFLATMFDWFFFISVSGVAFFTYVIMWGVVPESNDLEDDVKVKKLFRNPDNKVLGGVASGLAAYFGVEVTVIRVLLALGMLAGGTTFIAYCILWAITPEAKTLTEKMEMEGEPITLKNIEEKIKQNFNLHDDKEETPLAKVLLLPFRLVAKLFAFLTPLVNPFGSFFLQSTRVVFGLMFIVLGFAFIFSFTTAFLALLGFFNEIGLADMNNHVKFGDIPTNMLMELVPSTGIYSGYAVVIIPSIALVIAGISMIARRKIVSGVFSWSLFGIWLVSLGFASTSVAEVAKKFKKKESLEIVENLKLNGDIIKIDSKTVFDAHGKYAKVDFGDTKLTIKGYEGNEFKLVKHIEARGATKEEAATYTNMVDYKIDLKKDEIIFDNHFTLKENALFRAQDLKMELFVPYNQKIILGKYLVNISYYTVTPYGYSVDDIKENNTWIFTEKDGLKCLTCKEQPSKDDDEVAENTKKYDFKDFEAIIINSNVDVEIEQGEKFEITVDSDNGEFDNIEIAQSNKVLTIKALNSGEPTIRIVMPKLVSCEVDGKSDVTLLNFKSTETINLTVAGKSTVNADIETEKLICKLSDKAELKLNGKANTAEFSLQGGAELYAFSFDIQKAKIETSGASNAEISAENTIEISEKGSSSIETRGQATVSKK